MAELATETQGASFEDRFRAEMEARGITDTGEQDNLIVAFYQERVGSRLVRLTVDSEPVVMPPGFDPTMN